MPLLSRCVGVSVYLYLLFVPCHDVPPSSFSHGIVTALSSMPSRSHTPVCLRPALVNSVIVSHSFTLSLSHTFARAFADKLMDYNEKFRLYLATRNPHPSLSPSAAASVLVINFAVTRNGLEGACVYLLCVGVCMSLVCVSVLGHLDVIVCVCVCVPVHLGV